MLKGIGLQFPLHDRLVTNFWTGSSLGRVSLGLSPFSFLTVTDRSRAFLRSEREFMRAVKNSVQSNEVKFELSILARVKRRSDQWRIKPAASTPSRPLFSFCLFFSGREDDVNFDRLLKGFVSARHIDRKIALGLKAAKNDNL